MVIMMSAYCSRLEPLALAITLIVGRLFSILYTYAEMNRYRTDCCAPRVKYM